MALRSCVAASQALAVLYTNTPAHASQHAQTAHASQHAQTGQHVCTIHGLTEPRAQSSMLTTSEEEDENRDG